MHILRVLLPKPTGLQNFSKRNEKKRKCPGKTEAETKSWMLETGTGDVRKRQKRQPLGSKSETTSENRKGIEAIRWLPNFIVKDYFPDYNRFFGFFILSSQNSVI
jgi:hypothetical protein